MQDAWDFVSVLEDFYPYRPLPVSSVTETWVRFLTILNRRWFET